MSKPMSDQHEDDLVSELFHAASEMSLLSTEQKIEVERASDFSTDAVSDLMREAATRITDLTRQLARAKVALSEIALLGEGRKLNWGDAQDAIDIAKAALNPEQTKS